MVLPKAAASRLEGSAATTGPLTVIMAVPWPTYVPSLAWYTKLSKPWKLAFGV